jgi:hypothetical protein
MATLSSNLQSILENRLRYLPEITGQAINSIDWSGKLIEIGHKYGLHVDEMEEFQGVVLKSMIGLIDPQQFEVELINALALSPVTTEQIIAEINAQIFEPIHDYVMNNGKVDVMKSTGIVIEAPQDTPSERESMDHGPAQDNTILEIPASPGIDNDNDDFPDYF